MASRDFFNSSSDEWYPWLFSDHIISFENLFRSYFPLSKKTDNSRQEKKPFS